MNPSRRALLASFLAAPVAVRLGRWVKPAPHYYPDCFERHCAECEVENAEVKRLAGQPAWPVFQWSCELRHV